MASRKWLEITGGIDMRFFDKDYYASKLSDEEMNKRYDLYNIYINHILPDLKFPERELTRINFHDAKIIKIKKTKRNITIQAMIGDLQNGYQYLKICLLRGTVNKKIKTFNCLDAEFEICDNQLFLHFITDKLEDIDITFESVIYIILREIPERKYFSKKI